MGGSQHMSMTMGLLMTAGGAYAFFKKGSKASLIGGAGAGALFFVSAGLLQSGQNRNGHMVALATSAALVAGMAPRAYASKKFMPAGLVATLGLLSAAYQGNKTVEWWGES